MADDRSAPLRLPAVAGIALLSAVLGFAGGWAAPLTGVTRHATENVVRDYILDNPEILPQAIQKLQAREAAARVEPIRKAVETPFPGAFLGNPKGAVVLVEFSDYACGYCRQSMADVDALIAENPDLKVVLREYPILSPLSTQAARWALAAAQQGKFAAFHSAMFKVGRPSEANIQKAAQQAGLDIAKARQAITSPDIEAEIGRNLSIGQRMGFDGTPSWVIGDNAFSGALGKEALAKAIADARGK
ncbi:MAG: DsbA family protein [Novosphingobium sp.]